ncbi:hypothetical protein Ahy_B01g051732 [Arachis hypogaea]|uniref:Ubiquitin-like domain-containing protein n=1 Tax=Arachis hypogaea TaxID=3818 RepID=A0A445AMM3_ARAHY|nr:hypothetical protein Ahy_B01g051732 [Arachis hypogaea]
MEEAPSSTRSIAINVKFGGKTIPTSIASESTIKDLKSLLLSSTNVLPRKVLEDHNTLGASGLTNGSKLMLVASQGLHQGAVCITLFRCDLSLDLVLTRDACAKAALSNMCLGFEAWEGPVLKKAQVVPKLRRDSHSGSSNDANKVPVKNRVERWKVTGVVALSECNLEVIPDEVWACESSARVLDCNNNSIKTVPSAIAHLTGLEKLFINANCLSDESISWEGLTPLKYLTVLSLNQNNLTTLPSALGSLTALRELHVSNNKLVGLPSEIGKLTQLEVLRVNNNRMNIVGESVGNCHSLVEVDFSSNFLSELPETFSSFKNLKFEGWDDFDERRRNKHQKQLDFRVGVSRDFDEGADKN